MGLLSEGSPLDWPETKAKADHVRKHGIKQFINLYHKLQDRTKDVLYWGDEIEYMLVKLNNEQKKAQLALCAEPILKTLQKAENDNPKNHPTTWRPEYANYMVEGTPGKPYGGMMAHFNVVESNMRLRREEIQKWCGKDIVPLCLTSFPRTGSPGFTDPEHPPTPSDGASHSLFYPDQAIFPGHPRFKTLTRNIRQRRNKKVAINIPVYKDKNTRSPYLDDFEALGDDGQARAGAKPDHIYMDCMGFGMGCSCLQVTFQACNITEARTLYDELAPLCPIMLALSAAAPIFRGHLADIDARWTVISQSVDDRTDEERGEKPLKENKFVINKSRYDSIDSYLSPCYRCCNDLDLVYDHDIYKELIAANVDEPLSKHIAHLFIRDPVSLFSEKVNQDDEKDTDHFENIQSTNWQTMRFKPPPPNSNIGWRVEFRPMEVQLSDFENAAYTVFIVLLTRVILTYGLSFVIPISKVDENMKTAHNKDAVLNDKFYFRKEIFTDCTPEEFTKCMPECCSESKCQTKTEDQCQLMTIDEIINGSADFPGMIPLINQYLNSMEDMDLDVDTRCTISNYLNLISHRASGKSETTARWMRTFVLHHQDYKQDSVVSDRINYDLMQACIDRSKCCMSATKTNLTIPEALIKSENYLNKKNPFTYTNTMREDMVNGE